MNKVLSLTCFTFLAGCANYTQVNNYESKDNLEATNPLVCVNSTSVGPESTAAGIAAGAKNCANSFKYNEAAELIMVANAYVHFDAQRVTDKTAHGALNALFKKEFGSLSEAQINELFSSINALDNNQSRKSEICTYLISAPPPSYFPKYMIAQGMGAFTGSSKEPLIEDFNASEAWSKSMAFVKCSS
ncbi:hypothetical protein [Vibrio sp. AND4]|uniref:hypothetical protein n=1 Tax=Vibrio sp. AND4 TaxID=314289 RepID=UPI00015F23E3|nr:hypothetical protein [Vibrio sp. AND4]EDP57226.1 hypothetical protein AND4_08702 [Vibrio sp. AND4]